MNRYKRRFAPTRQFCVCWTLLCASMVLVVSTPSIAADPDVVLTPEPDQRTVTVSIQNRDFTANGDSRNPTVSPDGRFLSFQSRASDIGNFGAGGEPFDWFQIYLVDFDSMTDPADRDIRNLEYFRSVTANGQGNGNSIDPSLAPDRFAVAFSSVATNLHPLDGDILSDVYVFEENPENSVVRLISLSASNLGHSGSGASDQPSFGGDGIVAFRTKAPDVGEPVLAAEPLEHTVIVWADLDTFRDQAAGVAPRIFKIMPPDASVLPNGDSRLPHVSADGTKIVFETEATNFVSTAAGPPVSSPSIVLYDRAAQVAGDRRVFHEIRRLSRSRSRNFPGPKIGMGGKYVVFTDMDKDSKAYQVFLRDLETGEEGIVSRDRQGLVPSFNNILNDFSGSFVVFTSDGNMSPLDNQDPQLPDVYLHNLENKLTRLVSISPRTRLAAGTGMDRRNAEVTDDGRYVAFFAKEPALLPIDIQKSKNRQTAEDHEDIHVFLSRLPDEFSLPSNGLLLGLRDQGLVQVDLEGNVARTGFRGVQDFRAVTVDEFNVAWVLAGNVVRRFQSLSGQTIGSPVNLDGLDSDFTHIVATGGRCWVAGRDRIVQLVSRPGSERLKKLENEVTYDPVGEVSLALDSGTSLWAVFRAASGERILHIEKYDRDTLFLLDEIHLDRNRAGIDPDEYFNLIDIDENGDVFARSPNLLCRFLSGGDLVWTRSLNGGDGLVVDGEGNAFVVTRVSGDQTEHKLLGFSSAGHIFFSRLLIDAPDKPSSTDLIVDGESGIWALFGGSSTIVRVDPAGPTRTVVLQNDAAGVARMILDQHNSNGTGYRTANVVQPEADSDIDGFSNKDEIRRKNNPFDARPPDDGERLLPPVEDLQGSYEVDTDVVELRWRAPIEYCEYSVFRNNKMIYQDSIKRTCDDGSGFICFQDVNPPAGFLHYRIAGVGVVGDCKDSEDGGRAAGVFRKEKDPALSSSEPLYEDIYLLKGNEGRKQAELDFKEEVNGALAGLQALATYDDLGKTKVLVAYTVSESVPQLAIFTLDGDMLTKDEVSDDIEDELPTTGKLVASPIVGLHVDSVSKLTHVLLENGDMLRFNLGELIADKVLDDDEIQFLGNVHPEDNYLSSGLEKVSGRFFSLICPDPGASKVSGPGIDCIIGITIEEDEGKVEAKQFGRTPLSSQKRMDDELGEPFTVMGVFGHRVLDRAVGLALLDSDSLLVSVRSGETPYDDVAEIDVTVPEDGGEATFAAGPRSISMADVSKLLDDPTTIVNVNVKDVAYVPSSDHLIVLDSNQSRVVVLEASFPEGPTVSLDPPSGHWDDSTTVTITVDFSLATDKPAPDKDFPGDFENCLRCDGNEVTFTAISFLNDVATLEFTTEDRDIGSLDPPVRVIALAIHTLDGISVADFSAGFLRGEIDEKQGVDFNDALELLKCELRGCSTKRCADQADVDDSGVVDFIDAIVLLKYIILGGEEPAWPFATDNQDPTYGQDRKDDDLENCGDQGSEWPPE